jgi:hypothetical protein
LERSLGRAACMTEAVTDYFSGSDGTTGTGYSKQA